MGESPWTKCRTCNRVLWKGDEDADGNCCFCEKPKPPVFEPPVEPEKEEKKKRKKEG